MNTETVANEKPGTVNINCQYAFIGDNTVANLQSLEAQGNLSGRRNSQHEKVTSVHTEKPFHVSRIRKEELNDIESLFSKMSNEDVVKTVYLTGLPGAGKTELARQYGEQFSNGKSRSGSLAPLVITLNAKSEESLLKSLQDVTRKLRLSVGLEQTHQNLIDLIQLGNHLRWYDGAWLLIIDDMFENNDFNNLLPRPGGKEWGGGQILVTTQDNNVVPACHPFAKKLSLNEGMAKEDALALLVEISEVEADDFAEEIIKELHHLPLALACCATYVGETRQDRPSTKFGWKDYVDLYRENVKLESRTFSKNNNVYPLSMENAVTMAVNRMSETSDVLRLAFSFLSYCDFLPVPLDVLSHYVRENLPVQNDKQPTTKELIANEISRCTLLVHERSQNVETIKCHQVIYHAFQRAKDAKPDEQLESEFVKMMKSVNDTLDFMDNTSKEDVFLKVLVRPHLQLFVKHANDKSWNNTAEFVLISMKKDQFLFSTFNMLGIEAVQSLESLYDISLELDLSDERRCDILANIGFYYLELDLIEDALICLRNAYDMTEGKSENEWLLLRCRISFNLARAHYEAHSAHLAVQMKESVKLAKKVYINEEDKIMLRFLWLARFHLSWKNFWKLAGIIDEATQFYTSCVADCVSLSRARCLSFLSQIYMYYGLIEFIVKPWNPRARSDLAMKYLRQSLTMYEKVFGEDPFECRTQLKKAHEMCVQNYDKFTQSLIVAFKKHWFHDLRWWRSSLRWILNLRKGHLLFRAQVNICDDILEDYDSGRISRARTMRNPIRLLRTVMVGHIQTKFRSIKYQFQDDKFFPSPVQQNAVQALGSWMEAYMEERGRTNTQEKTK